MDTGKSIVRNKFDVFGEGINSESGHEMKPKTKPKPKLTDAERHARFIETAREVGASDDPKDFDKAFTQIAPAKAAERSGSS